MAGYALNSGSGLKNERGIVLVIVLILSAIALAVMTALIYMITAGTQISGMEKRYKTAKEAGSGGWQIANQIIGQRANSIDTSNLINTLNNPYFSMNASIVTGTLCTGLYSGVTYTALQAKVLTPTSSWSSGCSKTMTIDPSDSTSYDMKFELGTGTKYTVFAKIVNTVEGNTGGDGSGELSDSGGVVNSTATIKPPPMPYLYTIEVDAENRQNPAERAKLSILYEY